MYSTKSYSTNSEIFPKKLGVIVSAPISKKTLLVSLSKKYQDDMVQNLVPFDKV